MTIVMVLTTGVAISDPAVTSAKTVWQGVYTEEQAARGKSAYDKECASCHMEDLSGEDFAPALIADAFILRWQGGVLADLLTVVKVTMPQDRPSGLADETYTAIVAHLLKMNGYPSGQQELGTEQAELSEIAFTER